MITITEMMTKRTLLAGKFGTRLFGKIIGFSAHCLIEIEVQGLTGAGHGERPPEQIIRDNC